jgi:hypothetical protein
MFDRRRDGVVDPPVYSGGMWRVSVTAIVVARGLFLTLVASTYDACQHAAWTPVALAAMFAWQGSLAAYAILPPERSSRDSVQDIGSQISPATRS